MKETRLSSLFLQAKDDSSLSPGAELRSGETSLFLIVWHFKMFSRKASPVRPNSRDFSVQVGGFFSDFSRQRISRDDGMGLRADFGRTIKFAAPKPHFSCACSQNGKS